MKIATNLEQRLKEKEPGEQIHVIAKTKRIEKSCLQALTVKPEHSIRREIKMAKVVSMALPVGKVIDLAKESWVKGLELDRKVYASLDRSVPFIGAGKAWKEDLKGRQVRVAIVDTGIDKNHPDLVGRVVATEDFTLEGFVDLSGHGTHVAGIAVGSGKGLEGKYTGVAPEALILAAKVLKTDGSGRMSDVMAGVEWAVELGADIINLSLGAPGPGDGTDALSEICDAAVSQGVVICVAAGNDGPDRRTIGSPGCARKVITVGACTEEGQVPDFSSRGPTADGRTKPNLVAPGVDIVSCRANEVKMGQPIGRDYTSATGTSMATPHVSGLAALLLEAKPGANPELVKEALVSTAKDLHFSEWVQGSGLPQAQAALEYIRSHEVPSEKEPTAPPVPGCLASLLGIAQGFRKRRQPSS